MRRVVIIGSGGVAEALAQGVFESEGLVLVQVYGRNSARVREIAERTNCRVQSEVSDADIYIISVSDRAIEEVSCSIEFPPHAIVLHTAGSVAMDVIDHPRRGVLYPLQSFTPGRRVNMGDVPFFVEGVSAEVESEVDDFARVLSKSVIHMDSEGRKTLHLCGVFASNFVNAIYAIAADVAQQAEIPFDLLKPLIRETCDKAISVDTPRTVQTGPAVRGDLNTQQRHLEMLGEDEKLKSIYKILSEQIWETSKKM